jgi:hypothetical protein
LAYPIEFDMFLLFLNLIHKSFDTFHQQMLLYEKLLLLNDLEDFKSLLSNKIDSFIIKTKNINHYVRYIEQMLFEMIDVLQVYQNVIIYEVDLEYHLFYYQFHCYIYLEID